MLEAVEKDQIYKTFFDSQKRVCDLPEGGSPKTSGLDLKISNSLMNRNNHIPFFVSFVNIPMSLCYLFHRVAFVYDCS